MATHALAPINLRTPFLSTLGRQGLDALERVESWFERRREHRQLSMLDGRALKDLGLSRADVAREATMSSWRV